MQGGVRFHSLDSEIQLGLSGTTTIPCQLILDGILEVFGSVNIYRGVKVVVFKNAFLQMGNGTYINEYSRIFCADNIRIGKGCAIAWHVTIMDTDLHKIYLNDEQCNPNRPITIGDDIWIGAYSIITKGSLIKNNVIIGSHTLAKGTFDSGIIYAGNPAKQIKFFDSWS